MSTSCTASIVLLNSCSSSSCCLRWIVCSDRCLNEDWSSSRIKSYVVEQKKHITCYSRQHFLLLISQFCCDTSCRKRWSVNMSRNCNVLVSAISGTDICMGALRYRLYGCGTGLYTKKSRFLRYSLSECGTGLQSDRVAGSRIGLY